MALVRKLLKGTATLLVVLVLALAGWLYLSPPDLIRVGSAYSAKIVCSNVFLAGRDAGDVLSDDVQAPGHPLLRLMRANVDRDQGTVSVGLLGIFGESIAVHREGLGCASVPTGDIAGARKLALPEAASSASTDDIWPQGQRVETPNADIARFLDDELLTGPGMRAVVVVHKGRIIGERYGAGFSDMTPLLGWSMTKSVNAAIIGTLVKAGKMDLNARNLEPLWRNDQRVDITVTDLMAMSSGLSFNEDYGDVTDVTRMLFLQPDMAAFAALQPLAGEIGKVWSYSSGTSVILSELWQRAAGPDALSWPRQALFAPLGMSSAVLEADEKGTFVGSSYLYATARDWVRFGQFLLQDGVWNGAEVLPQGFVAWMHEPAPASDGRYGKGQVWLAGPGPQDNEANASLPEDTYWLRGHDGQTIAIIPSQQLVVLRMGLTPSKLGYAPQALVSIVAGALR